MDKETKEMFEKILGKLDSMDKKMGSMENKTESMNKRMGFMENRMDSMKSRQYEMYQLIRSLEENVNVTRANQENMIHTLADMQGKINRITGEVEEHEVVIRQIRAIK